MIAKYVENLFMKERNTELGSSSSSIDEEMLEKFGFSGNNK